MPPTSEAGSSLIVHEDKDIPFNLAFAVESTGKSYPEITPHTFAFNTAEGMCLDCFGLGYQYGANLVQKPEIMGQSIHRPVEGPLDGQI